MLRDRNRGFSKSKRRVMCIEHMRRNMNDLEASANALSLKVAIAYEQGNIQLMIALQDALDIVNKHVRSTYNIITEYEV